MDTSAETKSTAVQHDAFLAVEALLNFPGGMYAPALEKNARAALAKITALINSHAELVEALHDTLSMLRAAHMQCGIHHNGNARVIKSRAALAKAKGEQP